MRDAFPRVSVIVPVHDGGETIFSLPNGFQADYLNTAKGDRLDDRIISTGRTVQDDRVEIVNGLQRGSAVVLNPDARMTKGQKVVVR